MSRRRWPLVLVAAVPLLATACGGSAGNAPSGPAQVSATKGADGVQEVTIDTADNFRFVPAVVQAHVGELRIVLTDHGSYPHNISFPAMHATSKTVSGSPGRQQTTFTMQLTHPGNYDFVCTFHSSAGMKGRITVS